MIVIENFLSKIAIREGEFIVVRYKILFLIL